MPHWKGKSTPDFKRQWLAITEAIELGISPIAVVVLCRLLDHHNRDTQLCNPSEATLARAVGRCERTVRKAIRELGDRGLIRVERSATRKASNRYAPDILYRQESSRSPEENLPTDRQESAAKTIKETNKKTQPAPERKFRRIQCSESANSSIIPHKDRGNIYRVFALRLGDGEKPDFRALKRVDQNALEVLAVDLYSRKKSLDEAAVELENLWSDVVGDDAAAVIEAPDTG